MLAIVNSCGIFGLNGFDVRVETDLSGGLPHYELVGLPDAAVKESRERVRSAIKNSGFSYPNGRLIINLAPADQKKEGPMYDLPIAVAILLASEQIALHHLTDAVFLGELSLNGELRPVNGVLPMVISLRERGIKTVVLPTQNAKEAAYVEGINVLPLSSLGELKSHLDGSCPIPYLAKENFENSTSIHYDSDFCYIKGQHNARRAVEIAVSGGHNILLIGPPGSGKSMLAKAVPSILPNLTFDEALEITKIHSVSGDLDGGIILTRPFRSPHHSSSTVSLIGGGQNIRPGEISLAHNGVLFMDELPEFQRDALESLRQPLEDGEVHITRANAKVSYPSRFTLIAAMNPCPCGNHGDPNAVCRCTPGQIKRYLSRISSPLLDRLDLHIEVPRLNYDDISLKKPAESSFEIRKRVNNVRKLQFERYKGTGIFNNASLRGELFDRFCTPDKAGATLMRMAFDSLNMSARSYNRVLMVARTIADMDGSETIGEAHIAEAIQYRTLDSKYWGD